MTITPTTDTAPARPIIVVGAGPGIGLSVARRFAREGHRIGLVARDAGRLDALADRLRSEGATVATSTADATDTDQLGRAVHRLVADLGDPVALCFSPLPDVGLIGPVLQTSPADLMDSLRLNVAGAAAATEAVLPSLRRTGGSLLFTTGSAALDPSPERAASAVTTTAATTWIELVRRALDDTGVRVGHTVIVGPVDAHDPSAHHPDDVAEALWSQHTGPEPTEPSVLRL